MIGFISNLFNRSEPSITEASARDASAIAALHGRSFRRGWSEPEVEGLLLDRHVIAHRATGGAKLNGFILSRLVEDEAEILSVAVDGRQRGRGLARKLEEIFERDRVDCIELDARQWKKRGLLHRVKDNALYLLNEVL